MAELTDYEKYIRTAELLGLQKRPEDLSCHDEMQFQVVHQVAELWMRLIEHEIRQGCARIEKDDLGGATATLARVQILQGLLLDQLALLDTMAPKDYMTIRTALGQGSGQESPGFKMLLRLPAEVVWPKVEALLKRKKLSLRAIYEDHEKHAELFRLCEALTSFDQSLQVWRHRHLMMVYRIIGAGTPSLKGKPSELLERGMKQRFFPELWDVRDEVFATWTKTMLDAGKEPGYH